MSITVVGSIAFDSVQTPFGERERMLGGAATHFALAASMFDQVNVVGPVGEDFGDRQMAILRTRSINVDDVERVEGGQTFFWAGRYHDDLNVRDTLDTQLNVFEHFAPKLSENSTAAEVLFLANIQPTLQLQVREQCERAQFVALDSMNLWIDIARDDLVAIIKRVDCLVLNDEELRQLTGKPNLYTAAREILSWGPSIVIAKQGQYGAALITADSFFALPAYPMETVIDPTGAGDTFAGGFVGYLAAQAGETFDDNVLRNAMAYGTALASYNVQQFGTEALQSIDPDDVRARVGELWAMGRFDRADPEAFVANSADVAPDDLHAWRVLAGLAPEPAPQDPDLQSRRYAAVLIAVQAQRPLGMAGVRWFDPEHTVISLWGMWVDPVTRGSGLGRRMVDHVSVWGAEHGAHTFRLGVFVRDGDATGFYERLGFTAGEDVRAFDGRPAISMTRPI